MKRLFFIAFLVIASAAIYAQLPDNYASRNRKTVQDSVKKKRILREWTLSSDYSREVPADIDTVFSLSNRFKLADKYSPVNASLGNYGLPFYQISFFDRITDPEKFLYSYYYPLMHLPNNAVFMNTQVPYTEIDWSFAGPKETSEQTFRIRHSQNINRFVNFGLIYDIAYSLGQYTSQRSDDKTFTFYTSYTGEKYKAYFSAGINNLTSYENGGIQPGADLNIANSLDVSTSLATLNKANSVVKNKNILLVQRYTFSAASASAKDTTAKKKSGFFGLSGTLSHIFTIESTGRAYNDQVPASGFYDYVFITLKATSDSLHNTLIKNTVRFDFATDESRKFRLGGGAGIRNELNTFYNEVAIPFPMKGSSFHIHKNSNVLLGKLYNNIGDKFSWNASGEFYLTGYRLGDFNLNGEILKSFIINHSPVTWAINGSMMNRQPSFWYEHWGANNFRWSNNFKKEFRIDVGSSLRYPAKKTELKFNYAVIKNYTDFDTTAHPSQYSGAISVASLALKNELKLWKFHLVSDIIVQKSTNRDILDLPLAAVREAFFFEHLFRFEKTGGKLNTQLGADVIYTTAYHPYSYMPATGRFYRQDKITDGNYPFINLFFNFKVKRTRVFIMFDHVNAKLMGYNYEMVPFYPMNIRMLRYGLSWTFYN